MVKDDSVFDEENELLLLSDLCDDNCYAESEAFVLQSSALRGIRPVEIQVSVRILNSLPVISSDEIRGEAVGSTIYTQHVDLLSKLRFEDGQLCLLKSRETRKSTSDIRQEHPVTLKVLSPNHLLSSLPDSVEMLSENDSLCKVYVPPCIAASVGFYDCTPLSNIYFISPLEFRDGSRVHFIKQLNVAKSASLREISPPPCDNFPAFYSTILNRDNGTTAQQSRLEKRQLMTIQTLQKYFSHHLPGQASLHIMNERSLLAIDDTCSCFVRFFEIHDFQLLNDKPGKNKLNTDFTCFVISPVTRLVLLPHENKFIRSQPCRRLPHVESVRTFYHSVIGNGSISAESEGWPDFYSHPSFHKIVDALLQIQIYGYMQNSFSSFESSTLAVVGHEDNFLNSCLDAAAATVGMRIIHVRGLAAFGFRTQSMLSDKSSLQSVTGSTRDKLIGLIAAFDFARRSAPCIIHISLDGEIFCFENMEEEYDCQNRLLSCLQEELKQTNRAVPKLSNIDLAPSVQLVLSTARDIIDGPLLSNLVHDVAHVTPPDAKYARMLWSDDSSFDELYLEHLQGRSASEILYIKKSLGDNIKILDTLTQNVLAICENMENRMMGAFHGLDPSKIKLCKVPDVRWEDIGGLHQVRKEIFDAIELPLQYPNLFVGIKRRGILLHGPPGSGKTLVAKAVATEYGLPFISVKGPELLGSYVGESEANIRNVFSMAREAASVSKRKNGAILFFDEIDSLAPHRGQKNDGGGIMDRVTVTFLGELDMVRGESNDNVYVICATNRPDLLDPALLRPGRLDKILYLGLPDSREDRIRILAAQCRRFTFENNQDSYKMAEEVIDNIPPNLSGADLAAISSAAIMKSIERLCSRAESQLLQKSIELNDATTLDIEDVLGAWNKSDFVPVVTNEDFVSAALKTLPSIQQDDLKVYEKLKTSFV